ncbi:MAG: hypothetical protein HYT28_00065 [Parcubacteria group bacterium]|nr:hypothetical protein [Parcubacteria group bacterium]
MQNFKTYKENCKIIAIGDVHLFESPKDKKTERVLAKNKNLIEEIWEKASREEGLFNEDIFSCLDIKETRGRIEVRGNFVGYKNFLAQRKRLDLDFGIRPIGVSGITIVKDGNTDYVIFAKRTPSVNEYQESLELIPSGSIDRACARKDKMIDYKTKVLSEFSEETGLPAEYVENIDGFAVVFDANHKVYDVCCTLSITCKRELIAEKFKNSKEYQSPIFVPLDTLDAFLKTNAKIIIPTSMALACAFLQKK